MKIKLFSLAAVLLVFASCIKDKCTETYTYNTTRTEYKPINEIRTDIHGEAARSLKNPTQIYVYGQYLLIGDQGEGIHVVDNANPSSPQRIAFIPVRGNNNFTIKNNILLADNYMDLVSIDLSDLTDIKLVNRMENVFHSNMIDPTRGYGYQVPTTIVYEYECDQYNYYWMEGDFASLSNGTNAVASSTTTTIGVAGSMSAFAVNGNYLYAITNTMNGAISVINISNPASPVMEGSNISAGWNIETLFVANDNLFVGSTTGMMIYSLTNASNPVYISTFNHFEGCDPVFVKGNRAYVTIHTGNRCGQNGNSLIVIDISNLNNPTEIKSYDMTRPMGLSVLDNHLFLCEDESGVKIFDINNETEIDKHLLNTITGFNAYDVIALDNNNLIVTGNDGIYQYNVANVSEPNRLSVIEATH